MENKGIIVKGGAFEAKNVVVGDNATMTINENSANATRDVSPENTALSDKIKRCIAQGKIEEAFEILVTHFKSKGNKDALNAVIMHESAFEQLEKKQNLDLLTHEQVKIDRAKINKAILQLIDNEL